MSSPTQGAAALKQRGNTTSSQKPILITEEEDNDKEGSAKSSPGKAKGEISTSSDDSSQLLNPTQTAYLYQKYVFVRCLLPLFRANEGPRGPCRRALFNLKIFQVCFLPLRSSPTAFFLSLHRCRGTLMPSSQRVRSQKKQTVHLSSILPYPRQPSQIPHRLFRHSQKTQFNF